MSIERKSEYYDEIYSSSVEYSNHFSESVYINLWEKVFELIPKDCHLIDLGCGTGQFAEFLRDKGVDKYTGIDFSQEAIKISQSKKLGDFVFYQADLNMMNLESEDGIFVSLETFEHLKDYTLINNLGLGREIIFTVPDFNDAAHVRYFLSLNQVIDRYKNVIKFEHAQKFERWFICKGVTI